MTIEIGSTVKGTVVSVADYGAIVRLDAGKTGLVHISEIADAFVHNVRDYLAEDDEVTVKVLRINPKGRYELSLKQCDVKLVPKAESRELASAGRIPARKTFDNTSPPPPRPAATFEDRLSRFLKDSEQRQHDLKRHLETKRGRK